MADWNIQRPAERCAVSGRMFKTGEAFWSGLFEVEGNWVRVDFAEDAWEARQDALKEGRQPDAARVTLPLTEKEKEEKAEPRTATVEGEAACFWRSVKTAGDTKPRQRYVDDDVLMDFFRRMENTADARRQAFRFVLALHLIRRKRLNLASIEHDEGQSFLILVEPKGEDTRYRVLDPQLSEEEILELREQMAGVLEMEGEEDAAADEAPAQNTDQTGDNQTSQAEKASVEG